MTEVYCLDRAGESLPEEAAERLPPWRRERWERLRNEKSRQESLCAGLLYAYALERRGVSAGEEVVLLPAGKPVLRDRTDVFFSLSHSGRYILCAVSGAAVGADVQERRDVRESMSRRFHPAERRWLESVAPRERQAAFFRLWTRKEAWVKAVSGERTLSLAEEDVIHPPAGLFFREYELPEGYAAAVCGLEREIPGLTYVTCADLWSAGNGR